MKKEEEKPNNNGGIISGAYGESRDGRKRIAAETESDEFKKKGKLDRYKELVKAYERFMGQRDYGSAIEAIEMMWGIAKTTEVIKDKDVYAYVLGFRKYAGEYVREGAENGAEVMQYIGRSYRLTAKERFDDFCIYTEWHRPLEQKFYLPRRKMLLPIVRELQRLADDEIDILCISAPPGIGKSALAIFFICWLGGRNPDEGILVGSHSRSILEGMYGECVREMQTNGDYLFADVFPENQIARTDAANLKIDLKTSKRFSTFQFGAIGEKLAGKVRAMQLLYCDDLIESMQEALSITRLDSKWNGYSVDLRQRKQGKCKELHIATRWSVHDIIGRLEEKYRRDKRAVFLKMPALDDKGKSLFDYGGSIGFSTAFFEAQRDLMDDASFKALYMQEPIERGGLLYERDELEYYYDLPEGEPDGIIAVCDTATGGGDYTCMPVGYIYGDKHYIVDAVMSNQLPEVTDGLCAEMLHKYHVQRAQFESNGAGGRTADIIEGLVADKVTMSGGKKTAITKKYTTANKETKILLSAAWVKEHCVFRDAKKVKKNSNYAEFMRNLLSYTVEKPPKHDDAADAMAQYSLFADSMAGAQVQIVKRLW